MSSGVNTQVVPRWPVRVGLLIDGSEAYGLLTFLRDLLEALDHRRVQVVGIFLGSGAAREVLGPLCDEVGELGTGCFLPFSRPDRGRYDLANAWTKVGVFGRALFRIAAAIRRHRLDVVHANFYPMHLLAGLACRLTGTPCLWHWHGPFVRGGLGGRLGRVGFAGLADHVVCISRFVQQTLPAAVQVKSTVVYNGVQVERIASGQRPGVLRNRAGVRDGQPLVGLFGALAHRKGHEYFIRAAAQVLAVLPEARFGIVGGESEICRRRYGLERQLRGLAAELGVSDKLHFLGPVEDAPLHMGDCEVICMPTVPIGDDSGEGFGLTMAEAMAAGVPVIATSCGAPPEVIKEGVSGLLVPPRDSAALAGAILRLLQDDGLRKAMGRAGQRRIAERFDVAHLARGMEIVYAECGRPVEGGSGQGLAGGSRISYPGMKRA